MYGFKFVFRQAILFPLLAAWIVYARFFHPLAGIPGPFWASISRMWLGAQVSSGKSEYVQRELHRKHGPLARIAQDEVSVSDPDAIKIIYNIKSGFKKTDFYPPFAPNISPHGDPFTQLDEQKHADRRRYVQGVYSMSTILESEDYIASCSDMFLSKMSKFAEEGRTIDLGEWVQWYTFDVIGELFFGHQFGFMRDEHDYGHYIESLDTLLPGIALSCVLPSYLRPLHASMGMLIPTVRNSIKGFDEIRAAGRYWTKDRLEKVEAKTVDRTDLLDKFFKIRQEKEGWDVPDIANEACVAIFAGSDTTAIAIRSILYHLMRRRACYEKLVAEIDQADAAGKVSSPHIKYSEALKLPYLVACCKEGMRLHPSVGLGMPHHVPAGGKVIAGRFFPEGSRVSINAAVVHYDENVFGKDAADFNPDRWLVGDAANMDKHMLHFGGGSRTCIGKNISLAEMHKLIPQFLRKFHIELADPAKEWHTENFWFNKQTGIHVRVTAR